MTAILLLRHGESTWNAVGRWQGHSDPALSELGERQARHAAERLPDVELIVSSDLQRAQQTAAFLAEPRGSRLEIEPLLRERDAGPWEGLTRNEIEAGWPGYLERRERPAGFEADTPLLERALAALSRITKCFGDVTLVAVAHGGIIRTVEDHLGKGLAPIANLEGRWITIEGGEIVAGDRLVLVDPDERTTPPPV